MADLPAILKAAGISAAAKDQGWRIGKAIENTWNNNFGLTYKDRISGYLCWEWAWAFFLAAHLEKPTCFRIKIGGGSAKAKASTGDLYVHHWVEIISIEQGFGETVAYVDDGYFTPGRQVHLAPPLPPGWVNEGATKGREEVVLLPTPYDSQNRPWGLLVRPDIGPTDF